MAEPLPSGRATPPAPLGVAQVLSRRVAAVLDVTYDRKVLVDVLVYHYRRDIKGCGCGWAELGRSWPEHVATVYEESMLARQNVG